MHLNPIEQTQKAFETAAKCSEIWTAHSRTHLPAVLGSQNPQQNDEKERSEHGRGEVPPGDVGASTLEVSLRPVVFLPVLFPFFQIGFGFDKLALVAFHRSDGTLVGVIFEHKVVRQKIDDQLAEPYRHNDARYVRGRHRVCLLSC